jgi:hypothetical protein
VRNGDFAAPPVAGVGGLLDGHVGGGPSAGLH